MEEFNTPGQIVTCLNNLYDNKCCSNIPNTVCVCQNTVDYVQHIFIMQQEMMSLICVVSNDIVYLYLLYKSLITDIKRHVIDLVHMDYMYKIHCNTFVL